MQKMDLFYNCYPQGTNNILSRPMSFLIQGNDERCTICFKIIDCTLPFQAYALKFRVKNVLFSFYYFY